MALFDLKAQSLMVVQTGAARNNLVKLSPEHTGESDNEIKECVPLI